MKIIIALLVVATTITALDSEFQKILLNTICEDDTSKYYKQCCLCEENKEGLISQYNLVQGLGELIY